MTPDFFLFLKIHFSLVQSLLIAPRAVKFTISTTNFTNYNVEGKKQWVILVCDVFVVYTSPWLGFLSMQIITTKIIIIKGMKKTEEVVGKKAIFVNRTEWINKNVFLYRIMLDRNGIVSTLCREHYSAAYGLVGRFYIVWRISQKKQNITTTENVVVWGKEANEQQTKTYVCMKKIIYKE